MVGLSRNEGRSKVEARRKGSSPPSRRKYFPRFIPPPPIPKAPPLSSLHDFHPNFHHRHYYYLLTSCKYQSNLSVRGVSSRSPFFSLFLFFLLFLFLHFRVLFHPSSSTFDNEKCPLANIHRVLSFPLSLLSLSLHPSP